MRRLLQGLTILVLLAHSGVEARLNYRRAGGGAPSTVSLSGNVVAGNRSTTLTYSGSGITAVGVDRCAQTACTPGLWLTLPLALGTYQDLDVTPGVGYTYRLRALVGESTALLLDLGTVTPTSTAPIYYVNSAGGCSDGGAGSIGTPFCTFTPINAISNGATLAAGSTILLARGVTWNQELVLKGNGSSASIMNTLGAYGTGVRPKIIRNGQPDDRTLRMTDPSYWRVEDLELGWAGEGVLINTVTQNRGLRFARLYIHQMYGIAEPAIWNTTRARTALAIADGIYQSAGIGTSWNNFGTASALRVVDIAMEDVEFAHNANSISFHTVGDSVVLNRLYAHDEDADGGGTWTGCQGLSFWSTDHLTILGTIVDRAAACAAPRGTAAMFFGGGTSDSLSFATLVNSIIRSTPHTGSYDETGIDHEAWTDNIYIRNSYLHSNAGGGIEYLLLDGLGRVNDHHTDEQVTGTLFANNGPTTGCPKESGQSVVSYSNYPGSTPHLTGLMRDNLYREAVGFTTVCGGQGTFSFVTLTNNRPLVAGTPIGHAAQDFAATQGTNNWRYQYTDDGATFSDMAYTAGFGWTKPSASAPAVTALEVMPGPCATCGAARVWVAPQTGTVSIRARALKSAWTTGDGVRVAIKRGSGTVLWSGTVAFNDLVGQEAVLDSVSVTAGELIRFIVDPGVSGQSLGDLTSWVPTVVYTS